ncbi:hypothetical protein SDC9_158700 [bioreactor metagenome]|uniref:Uncharacterized protein n=1 Tax=bioreactor metagenome TaxID=1076179 RepID=A0A645FDF7_9ZZZZ
MDLKVFCKLVPEQNSIPGMDKGHEVSFYNILAYPHNLLFSFRVNPLNRNPFGIIPVLQSSLAQVFGRYGYHSLLFSNKS